MNTNWKAGDRALCVDDSPGDISGRRLIVLGCVYLVKGAYPVNTKSGNMVIGLDIGITDMNGNKLCLATRFRKLVPACDIRTQEQETTE